MAWLYFMKNCSKLLSHFSNFHAEIWTQFGVCLKTLKSENAGEYCSEALNSYLCTHGIIRQSSCANTPSRNGVAKSNNGNLLETARALFFQTHVPKHYWVDAIFTACFLINFMPSSVLQGQIPIMFSFQQNHCFLLSLKYLVVRVLHEMFILI